jgi:hypothetical protein
MDKISLFAYLQGLLLLRAFHSGTRSLDSAWFSIQVYPREKSTDKGIPRNIGVLRRACLRHVAFAPALFTLTKNWHVIF